MTLPVPNSYPPSNPGGQNRRTSRRALAYWLSAQEIRGVKRVYAGRAAQYEFDDYPGGGPNYEAMLKVMSFDGSDDRAAYDGPTGRGGILAHYPVGLQICHRAYDPADAQTGEDEDDYDRIIDAVKDCLAGQFRDLGRPEIVLMVAELPRVGKFTVRNDPPIRLKTGAIQRTGLMSFKITQYIADED